MKKAGLSILGLAIIALLGSAVWAQGMGGGGMMDDDDMPMMGAGGGMGCGAGWGGGMGMMGSGALSGLDLTAEQCARINKIQDEMRKQHWTVMGKIMDEQARLRDLYAEDKLDAKKITAVSDAIHGLRKQMIETRIDATNRMRDVLTKEQREQLKKGVGSGMAGMGYRRGGMMGR